MGGHQLIEHPIAKLTSASSAECGSREDRPVSRRAAPTEGGRELEVVPPGPAPAKWRQQDTPYLDVRFWLGWRKVGWAGGVLSGFKRR